MERPRIDEVAARLERLERQCRRWRWASGGLALLLALAIAVTAYVIRRPGVRDEILARRVWIVDDRGQPLIRLGAGAHEKGNGLIEFLDASGKTRMVFGTPDVHAAVITLIARDGQDQLVLDADDDRGLGITFRDLKRDSGLMLTSGQGIAGIGFMSGGRKNAFTMGVNPDDTAQLSIRDSDGEEIVHLPKR